MEMEGGEYKRLKREGGAEVGVGVERERYLCLGSWWKLFCVDVTRTEQVHGERCATLSNYLAPPAVLCPVDDDDEDASNGWYPLAAGVMKFPEDPHHYYLFGGELYDNSSDKSLGLSTDCFKLVPTFVDSLDNDNDDAGGGSQLMLRMVKMGRGFPKMLNSSKSQPIVHQMGDKVYVFHTYYGSRDPLECPPSPAFEVYDSQHSSWRPLPNPPFFITEQQQPFLPPGNVIGRAAVLGDRLFVSTDDRSVAFFDFGTEEWSCVQAPFLPYYLPAMCITTPAYSFLPNHLHVAISFSPDPYAFAVLDNGRVLAHQKLPQIFSSLTPRPEDLPITRLIPLDSYGLKGWHRMCAINTTGDCRNCLLCISFFRVCVDLTLEKVLSLLSLSERDPIIIMKLVEINVERSCVMSLRGFTDMSHPFNGPAFFL